MPDRSDATVDPLDRGLAAAFGPAPAARGVLETLADSFGPVPRVLLCDTDAGYEGPLVKPASTEVPDAPSRYQIFGEIARGGMGAVLKGRDNDLGRDLALKVLLEQHRENPALVRRIVEEAQIGGQLQHPGIVPVYELGSFPDRRPYFTMKLVKGRTLAALLSERSDARDDLPRFLGIFEQVAQTVAYAHARGVIHRDLKPSNVMVGSFGEVQVMDWGLAKVLAEGGVADEPRNASPPVEETVIRTVRSGSAEDESQAGSVVGTPAYMAPEQAGGDSERIDRRADVFGLGSILCEVLTGQPAYTGRSGNEVFRKATRGDTTEACARLAACEADADLVTLARDCLAAEPADRPRDAGAVAGRITAYLAGIQEKLRAAERERAVAEARAVEERRRHRLQLGLAVAVLALTAVGGLSTTYYLRQRQARAATVARILGEARILGDQARAHPDDPARWEVTLAAIQRVEDALGGGTGGDPETRRQSDALRDEAQAGRDGAERDRRLLDRVTEIRSARWSADGPYGLATDAAYADAFRDAGIDLAALSPAEAGARIKARPPATALALVAALDDWAAARRGRLGDRIGAIRLSDAARAADPDPWRAELRDALEQTGRAARLTALQAAARSARFDELGAVSLDLLGKALASAGDLPEAEAVLRAAQQRHPGDVWVNYDLAQVLQRRSRRDEAIRFYTVARSIRPETAYELAQLLRERGDFVEAIAVYQHLARLRPKRDAPLINLGVLLEKVGRKEEGARSLEAAVAAAREAIRLKPDDYVAYVRLGLALRAQGKLDDAIAAHRVATRLNPGSSGAHFHLGDALRSQGNEDDAIAAYRASIRLKPDDYWSHVHLGDALYSQRKLDDAITTYRVAIGLEPEQYVAHYNLACALSLQGKWDEVIAACRVVIRLKPDHAGAYQMLGVTLGTQGKYEEGLVALRRALELAPPGSSTARPLSFNIQYHEQLIALAGRLPAVIKGEDTPRNALEGLYFGRLCHDRGWHAAAARLYAAALTADPKLASDDWSRDRYIVACSAALAGCGKCQDDPPPDETARAALRQQALEWLKAERAFQARQLESAKPQARRTIVRQLWYWQQDTNLAGVRDDLALARLPEGERTAWRDFWSDVENLRKEASGERR